MTSSYLDFSPSQAIPTFPVKLLKSCNFGHTRAILINHVNCTDKMPTVAEETTECLKQFTELIEALRPFTYEISMSRDFMQEQEEELSSWKDKLGVFLDEDESVDNGSSSAARESLDKRFKSLKLKGLRDDVVLHPLDSLRQALTESKFRLPPEYDLELTPSIGTQIAKDEGQYKNRPGELELRRHCITAIMKALVESIDFVEGTMQSRSASQA